MIYKNMNYEERGSFIHLSDYIEILKRRKFIILLILLLTTSLTFLLIFLMEPIYRSSATIIIDKELSISPLTGERLDYDSYIAQSLTFNTHFKLIRSRPVLEQVVRNLNLDEVDRKGRLEVGTLNKIINRVKSFIPVLQTQNDEIEGSENYLIRLIDKLSKKIIIKEERNTRLLKIIVEDHNAELAMNIANCLAKVYLELNSADRQLYSKNSFELLLKQLNEFKLNLEKSEVDFISYKEQEELFSIEGKQKKIHQKINDFNDTYIKTRNLRQELEAKLHKLKAIKRRSDSSLGLIHLRSLLDNPLIDQFYNKLIEREIELSRLSNIFRKKHPEIIKLKTAIQETQSKLVEEINKELENLKERTAMLHTREEVLQKSIDEFEKEALETNRKEYGYIIRERMVETNRKLYNLLLSKMKETNVSANIDIPNIRMAEMAVASNKPHRPKNLIYIIAGFTLGLIGGTGFALFLEYLDRSIRTENDVHKFIGVPIISSIPKIRKFFPTIRKTSVPFSKRILTQFSHYPKLAEAYGFLKINIEFAIEKNSFKTILVSSAGKKEGKTDITTNLAFNISKDGKTVLIVDVDTNTEMLTRKIISKNTLITEKIISGSDNQDELKTFEEVITSAIEKIDENLFLLPSTIFTVDSKNLLNQKRMNALLSKLKKEYDVVIIDSRPILTSSDSLMLSGIVDSVILVIKAGDMKREMIRKTIKLLQSVQSDLIGIVLNQVKSNK